METIQHFLGMIFDIQDIFWFCAGLLVPVIASNIRMKNAHKRARKKIEHGGVMFTDQGIVSLAHGDPFYVTRDGREDISMGFPATIFHVAMPADIRKKILDVKPQFDNTKWKIDEQYLGNDTQEDFIAKAASSVGITEERFKDLLEEKKAEVGEMLFDKINDDEPYFNGEMYGILGMSPNRESDNEIATVNIRSYKSDYYTHRVMAAIYRELYSEDHSVAPSGLNKKYTDMNYFLTGVGVNTLLILEDECDHGGVVFVKRSGKLLNMKKDLWHVSMNEAVSITDRSDNNAGISLDKCITRGLNEELGIDISGNAYQECRIMYSDLFLLQDPLETGIASFVLISGLSFDDLKIAYSAAKDKELESSDIKMVPFEDQKLKDFVNKNDVSAAGQYLIKMLIARHMKKIIETI